MNRSLIIGIVVVVTLVVVSSVVVLVTRLQPAGTDVRSMRPGRTTPGNETANANRTITTREEKGTIEVNQSVTYRGTTFAVLTAAELDEFHGQKAGPGKQHVVLFLKPLAADDENPTAWIQRETTLRSVAGTSAPLTEAEIVGPGSSVDTGYLWFTTSNEEKNFTLVFKGEPETSLNLGF